MSLTFHWFLPTYGDSRHVVGGGHGVPDRRRRRGAARHPRLSDQIARAAEHLGFEGALTPTGAWCEDAWLTTAMLARETERLKFLVAFRPGIVSPTLAAQMAATFQRHSGGRLLLNVVTGGESHEQRAYGDFLDKDDRYAPHRRIPGDRRGVVGREDGRFHRGAPAGGGRPAGPAARSGAAGLLRRVLPGRRRGGRPRTPMSI